MEIELKKIKVKDLIKGYTDNADDGVIGYDGKLNIRPAFQREFVYKDKQREAVINTVIKGFPLNTMYWVVKDTDQYEILDGQQRTISLCQYINGDFSVKHQFFHNLSEKEKDLILNYELQVYFCEGEEEEKLEWFKTINIAGEKLTNQELRNAVYSGSWLTDAKKYFSKSNNSVKTIKADKYLKGSAIRQDYLETVLKWISNGNIEDYMAEHQVDGYATDLWDYFDSVIQWVKEVFPKYRKEMKGLDWGLLYNKYQHDEFDPEELEKEVSKLILDEDVTKKPGIYLYLLHNDTKYLNLRAFTPTIKSKVYEEQSGLCIICDEHFEIDEMEADHITPWSQGGRTDLDNCQMLCKKCNRTKSDK